MDRKLFSKGKLVRPKANLPSGSFIALGKEPTPAAKAAPAPLGKREAPATTVIPAKRPKLDIPDSLDVPSRSNFSFDQRDFVSKVTKLFEAGEMKSLDQVVTSVIKAGFEPRTKPPEPIVCASIALLAKERPEIFKRSAIIESLCFLLKHPTYLKTGQRPKSVTAIFICNLLYNVFADESEWPVVFAKAYLDDSLNERYWVDRVECSTFVKNLLSGFGTNLETLSTTAALHFDLIVPAETSGNSPNSSNLGESPMDPDGQHDFSNLTEPSAGPSFSGFANVKPRFSTSRAALQLASVDILKDWWNKRLETGVPKSLVLTMVFTSGLPEVRLTAAQRLEVWLQNAKIQRAALQLLFAVAQNTDCRQPTDTEVISHLTKLRLKTKSVTNAFLSALNVLFDVNIDNMSATLRLVIHNELSNNRSPHNMSIVSQCFHYSSAQAARVLGNVFQNLLMGKEDFSKALRILIRELIKGALKHDFPLVDFCQAITQERPEVISIDSHQRERLFSATIDLICVSIFSAASPSIRDAANSGAKSAAEGRNLTILRQFCQQISLVHREAVSWLHAVVPNMFRPQSIEYSRGFYRILFLEKQDYYSGKENWPTEQDRIFLLKMVSEAPLSDDTIFRILLVGLDADLPLTPADAIELVELLVKRAAAAYTEGYETLTVNRLDIVEILLHCSRYKVPETIKFAENYLPPLLALSVQYSKVISILLILSAHNPTTIGQHVWSSYPSLRCYMKMLMTGDFNFPPESAIAADSIAEILKKDHEAREIEQQEILELENNLASGAGKNFVSEGNSVLLGQLIRFDPKGPIRKPSPQLLEIMKSLNANLKLGLLLCKSRNPDFLIEIINGKGSANSLPWLIDMIDSNHGCLTVLPVQCLCEFLLHSMKDGMELSGHHQSAAETPPTPKKDKTGRPKENQRQKRTEELRERLRSIIWDKNDAEMITQIVGYFLSRLQAECYEARSLAIKALNVLLKSAQTPVEPAETVREPDEQMDFSWLFEYLPSLSCFKDMIKTICDCLHEALSVETSVPAIMAYLKFLHTHGGNYVEDFVVDLSRIIVERENLMERLLPSDSVWSAAQSDCFLLILDLYHMYLTKICSSSQGEFAWSSSQDHLMVKWGSAEAQQCAMLHVHVVSAMVLLLTFSPPPPSEQRESKYQQLMDFWFPVVKEEKPSANLVDTFEEAELYQDWLKLRMLSSKNPTVVQGVMEVISGEPMEVLMFLMSFGIPLESVEKLLELLDKFAEINDTFPVDPAQIKTVAGYIESHWRRGAASGHKFMEKFGSGGREAIEIDEQSSEITQILPQFVSNDGQREVTSAPMEVEAMLSSITSANGKEIDVEFVQNWSQLLCSVVVGEKDKDCVIDKLKSVEAEGAMKDLPMAALQRFSKTSMETTPSDSHMEVTKEEFDSEVKMAVENGTSNEAVVQNVLEWLMNVRSSGKEKNLSDIGEKLKQLVATNPEFVTYSQDLSVKAVFGENGFPGSDYLLAMLPHSMQMSNFLVVLKHLLDSHSEKVDPTRILDLVSAFIGHPTLWKGRDRKLTRYKQPNLEGQLSATQILTVGKYILHEANSNRENVESVIGNRLPLLMSLCSVDSVYDEIINWLSTECSNKPSKAAIQLLSEIYLQRPDVIHRMSSPNLLASVVPSMNASKMDELLNRLLRDMSGFAVYDNTSDKMEMINLAFRTLAVNYPAVFVRQLSSVAAVLRGTLNKTMRRLRESNWLSFLSYMLEIAELLQPVIFQPEYSQHLTELLDCYFGFIADHGVRSGRFINMIDKVFGLLHSYHAAQPEATAAFLEKHCSLIQHISQRFPQLTRVKTLLSRVTLPLPPIIPSPTGDTLVPGGSNTGRSEFEPLSARPISPISEADVIPVAVRLMKAETDVDLCLVFEDIREISERKPAILYHCKSRILSSLTSWNKNCRELAFELLVKRCRDDPTDSAEFFTGYLHSLKCGRAEVILSALKWLPGYIVTCRANSTELLKAAVSSSVQWLSPEASQMLCDSIISLHHNTSF